MSLSYGHEPRSRSWFLGTQHCLCPIFIHLLNHGRITILHCFIFMETFAHFQLLTHFILPFLIQVWKENKDPDPWIQ